MNAERSLYEYMPNPNQITIALLESKFVTKEAYEDMRLIVAKHDKVYNRVQNLLVYIGILATFQLVFGGTWRNAFSVLEKIWK